MLNVEAELAPALTLSTGAKRPWIVNPMGIETEFPVWGIFFAILPAVGFAVLGYLDQNFGGGPSALVLLVLAAGINLDINTSDGTTFVVSFWTTGGSIPP